VALFLEWAKCGKLRIGAGGRVVSRYEVPVEDLAGIWELQGEVGQKWAWNRIAAGAGKMG
jgi:hypothetical protein